MTQHHTRIFTSGAKGLKKAQKESKAIMNYFHHFSDIFCSASVLGKNFGNVIFASNDLKYIFNSKVSNARENRDRCLYIVS